MHEVLGQERGGMLLQSVAVSFTESLRHDENEACLALLILSKIKLLLRLASSFVT